MEYETLRNFSELWSLPLGFLTFLGLVAFAFRKGSSAIYKDCAKIPFRED